MLGQRRRKWANVKPASVRRLMFVGIYVRTGNTFLRSQNALSAHLKSKQILPFSFPRQNIQPYFTLEWFRQKKAIKLTISPRINVHALIFRYTRVYLIARYIYYNEL